MMLNSYWKIMTKFSFTWRVATMEMVKFDLKKQRYSIFIKY